MIRRLRGLPDMEATYRSPHDHRIYGHGHHLRVEQSKLVACWLAEKSGAVSGADLSCGNGAVLSATEPVGVTATHFGDYAPGWPYQGPIEQTVGEIPRVDLFVCCETLEHLDGPVDVLGAIREKAGNLVLGTPVGTLGDSEDGNGEHLWQWDREGVESMLSDTGWSPVVYMSVDSRLLNEPYLYGIWGCV